MHYITPIITDNNIIKLGSMAAGAALSFCFGGYTPALGFLLCMMVIDFITGLLVGCTGKSPKSKTGKLSSKIAALGLQKKLMCLLWVLIGHRIDVFLDKKFVVYAVCMLFAVQEIISIAENGELLGVPMPKVVKNVLDKLVPQDTEDEEK